MFRDPTRFDSIDTLSVNIPHDIRGSKSLPYYAIFQSLPTAALLLDLRNQVIICNTVFEQLTGYSYKEIIGNDLIEFFIPNDAAEPAKFLFGRLLLGEKVRDKQIVKFKNGKVREVEINGTPVFHKEEQMGVVILVDDEQFTTKQEFSKEYERLKQLAELSQLVGGIGHELRNPLCIIKNSAFLLERRMNRDESGDTKKFLAIIRREAEMANKIIINMLHFIRTRKPKKEWIDPVKPIDEVLQRYPLPENITLDFNKNSNGFQVLVDPDHIEVVLLNLITNAVQAMPSGGNLKIRLSSDGGRFIYRIGDSGCGIPDDKMNVVFKPFFSSQRNGIGLGLAISKQLIEANHGKISIQSELGIGTVCSIEFTNKRQI